MIEFMIAICFLIFTSKQIYLQSNNLSFYAYVQLFSHWHSICKKKICTNHKWIMVRSFSFC